MAEQTAASRPTGVWEEVREVGQVEGVLTPFLCLPLVTLSNLALLVHEARVAWRSRRLIPPKLLVMALASADLAATLLGFLPLWLLFHLHPPSLATSLPAASSSVAIIATHHPSTTSPPPSSLLLRRNGSDAVTLPRDEAGLAEELPSTFSSSSSSSSVWEGTTMLSKVSVRSTTGTVSGFYNDDDAFFSSSSSSLSSSPSFSSSTSSSSSSSQRWQQPVVHTAGYAFFLFLLTAFWTLAQCIVVVMGVERFLALRAPFFYTARCTCSTFLLVLAALALASCCVALFHLLVQLSEVKNDEDVDHHLPVLLLHPPVFAGFLDSRSLAHNVFTLVQGLLWTGVLLLCNWGVTRELRKMEESVTVVRGGGVKDQGHQGDYLKQLSLVHGAGREFARFMMAVNVVFLLSSCPNLVCVLLRLCGLPPAFSVQYFCWRMSHTSAVLNPFLYGFLRKSLRGRIRRFLNQRIPCLRSQRVGGGEEVVVVERRSGRAEVMGPVAQYRQNSHPAVGCSNNAATHNNNNNNNSNSNNVRSIPNVVYLRDPEASTVHSSD
ncbi:uncharacterized protein LOC143292328 [Babylonia areolata]|uniref:uncharacterized protein LOC143292328 n=1 Tax=Babylonia areolata TaxID=304850 RepID=UPI003FD28738